MASVCLPSDELSQHLPSYLGFSHQGCGGISSWLLQQSSAAAPDLGHGVIFSAAAPDLRCGVTPLGQFSWCTPLLWLWWGSISRNFMDIQSFYFLSRIYFSFFLVGSLFEFLFCLRQWVSLIGKWKSPKWATEESSEKSTGLGVRILMFQPWLCHKPQNL